MDLKCIWMTEMQNKCLVTSHGLISSSEKTSSSPGSHKAHQNFNVIKHHSCNWKQHLTTLGCQLCFYSKHQQTKLECWNLAQKFYIQKCVCSVTLVQLWFCQHSLEKASTLYFLKINLDHPLTNLMNHTIHNTCSKSVGPKLSRCTIQDIQSGST